MNSTTNGTGITSTMGPPPLTTIDMITTTTVPPSTTTSDFLNNRTTVNFETTTSDYNNVTTTLGNIINTPPPSEGQSKGAAIAGGITGGVVVAVVVAAVIVIIIRRNRRRECGSRNPRTLPRIEDLEIKIEPLPNIEKPYENLTESGETDPNTDPLVGSDGYLKKSTHAVNGNKPLGTNNNQTAHGSNNKAKLRVDSMPVHRAPAPPGVTANDPHYSEAHLGEVKLEEGGTGYTQARVPDKDQPGLYLDLEKDDDNKANTESKSKDKKTKPGTTHNEKLYENEDTKDNTHEAPHKFYENVSNEQSAPYYNTVKQSDKELVQDNYYEL